MQGQPTGPFAAKQSRKWTPPRRSGFGHSRTLPLETGSATVLKRSFKRACRRATEHGWTTYRGRTLQASQLSPAQIQVAQRMIAQRHHASTTPSQPPVEATSGRLRVMVWNCEGLAYQDLMQWLQTSEAAPDVLILVETRMAHDMEHMAQPCYIMHSSRPHAGVMIMIHKRMAPQHRVTWRILSPGRWVHVRPYGSNNSHINIIAYYQQAWQTQQAATCLKRRAELTAQLDQLLQSCSKCQLLLLGGDFNTAGMRSVLSIPSESGLPSRGTGPNGDLVQSRIDHLFMRHKHADQPSRDCQYDHDFILTAHRHNAQHSPMTFSTKAHWTPWQAQRDATTYSTGHRHALIQYYQHDQQGWQQWSDQLNHQVASQGSMDSALDSLCRLTQLKLAARQPHHLHRSLACIGTVNGPQVLPTCGDIIGQ